MWFSQGFAKEEDASFIKMVAEYEKASGNKIDYSLIPYAPLRQKEVSAIQSGVVYDACPDVSASSRSGGRSRITLLVSAWHPFCPASEASSSLRAAR